MKLLVVGAGAIGGITAARLAAAGNDTTLLVRTEQQASVLRSTGIEVAANGKLVRSRPLVQAGAAVGEFDVVLLATQPTELSSAIAACTQAIGQNTYVGCMQNGLGEAQVAEAIAASPIFGCIVTFGATTAHAGSYVQTARGRLTLGLHRSSATVPASDAAHTWGALQALLSAVAPVQTTTNLAGARWSKLIANCVVSTLGTIGGARLGALLRHRSIRNLALAVVGEGVAVANAEGIVLEPIAGSYTLAALAPANKATAPSLRRALQHAALLAFGVHYRNMRSSMLARIEAGKPPAIDFLNGELVSRARKHGIAAPVNTRLQQCVWDIAGGTCRSGLGTLHNLARDLAVG